MVIARSVRFLDVPSDLMTVMTMSVTVTVMNKKLGGSEVYRSWLLHYGNSLGESRGYPYNAYQAFENLIPMTKLTFPGRKRLRLSITR